MAIQQADKLLKKHRDLHCAKVSNIQSIPDLQCAQIGLLMFRNEDVYFLLNLHYFVGDFLITQLLAVSKNTTYRPMKE